MRLDVVPFLQDPQPFGPVGHVGAVQRCGLALEDRQYVDEVLGSSHHQLGREKEKGGSYFLNSPSQRLVPALDS